VALGLLLQLAPGARPDPTRPPDPHPRRLQCLFVLASFAMEAGGGVQQQLRMIKAFALEPLARQVCYGATQLLLAPLTLDESRPFGYCEDWAPAFAVVFPLLLVGAGAVLLSYRQERCAKLRHMQELRYMRELQGAAEGYTGAGGAGAARGEGCAGGGVLLVALVHGWAAAVVACVVALAWTEVVGWS
jgi:hypothetical protein